MGLTCGPRVRLALCIARFAKLLFLQKQRPFPLIKSQLTFEVRMRMEERTLRSRLLPVLLQENKVRQQILKRSLAIY